MRESSLLRMTAARRGGSEMGLWDFIQKRMEELGITQYDLETEYGIAYATLQRIKAGKPIKEGTKQKLALALKCSIGDINAAIASEMPNLPAHEMELLGKENGEPSVMETVDKLEQMVKTEHPYLAAPAEKEEKPKRKAAVRVIRNDPPKEKWPQDPPEATLSPTPEIPMTVLPDSVYYKQLEAARREGAEEYRQKLKDIGLKALVKVPILNVSGETPIGMAGRAILEELLKDDTGAE